MVGHHRHGRNQPLCILFPVGSPVTLPLGSVATRVGLHSEKPADHGVSMPNFVLAPGFVADLDAVSQNQL